MEVKFEHVDFCYEKVNYVSKEVFNDLNVVFKEGKVHGIVGKSGSGKTTLLELINSYMLPTNGKIKIGDFVISSNKKFDNINALRFQVGIVTQTPEEQFFNCTVYDELAFNLRYYNYHILDINKRVIDALKMVGLDNSYLNRNPLSLSKGEKRRLALAVALVHNPKVLLLDEPTIGLDNSSKENLIKLLRLLKNRYHKTIIISSHNTDFLHRIVDYVYVLSDKNIVLSGDKYEVFTKVKELKKYGVKAPKIIEFSNCVLEKKKIKIGYRDEINDLIKDVYRFVR